MDGVLLFDEDVADELLIDDKTIILAKTPPSGPVLPKPITKQGTEDTLSISDLDVGVLSDFELTPSPGETPPAKPKLPTFSTILVGQLEKSGQKPCDSDCWKRVCFHDENTGTVFQLL